MNEIERMICGLHFDFCSTVVDAVQNHKLYIISIQNGNIGMNSV